MSNSVMILKIPGQNQAARVNAVVVICKEGVPRLRAGNRK